MIYETRNIKLKNFALGTKQKPPLSIKLTDVNLPEPFQSYQIDTNRINLNGLTDKYLMIFLWYLRASG